MSLRPGRRRRWERCFWHNPPGKPPSHELSACAATVTRYRRSHPTKLSSRVVVAQSKVVAPANLFADPRRISGVRRLIAAKGLRRFPASNSFGCRYVPARGRAISPPVMGGRMPVGRRQRESPVRVFVVGSVPTPRSAPVCPAPPVSTPTHPGLPCPECARLPPSPTRPPLPGLQRFKHPADIRRAPGDHPDNWKPSQVSHRRRPAGHVARGLTPGPEWHVPRSRAGIVSGRLAASDFGGPKREASPYPPALTPM